MVFSPKFIFVDETFSNMDMESQARFEKYILAQQRQADDANRPTWVVISHQLSTIKRLCARTFFMESGAIKEAGDTHELLAHPKTPQLKQYVEFMDAR
jgi:ABC-type glutathione transport system ATPase component